MRVRSRGIPKKLELFEEVVLEFQVTSEMSYCLSMRKLVGLVIGGVIAFNGFSLLTANDCKTVSFDGQGGRVAVVQCFPDSSGAIPSWLAGLGMALVGVVVAILSLKRRA